jgi:hypothetical protein
MAARAVKTTANRGKKKGARRVPISHKASVPGVGRMAPTAAAALSAAVFAQNVQKGETYFNNRCLTYAEREVGLADVSHSKLVRKWSWNPRRQNTH